MNPTPTGNSNTPTHIEQLRLVSRQVSIKLTPMIPRVYQPQLQAGMQWLEVDEAHHIGQVLRLGVGDEVELFDGRGGLASAQITTVQRRGVEVLAAAPQNTPRPASRLTLAVAMPKGERADWLVEQACQLGVDRLIWLDTLRGVVKPGERLGKISRQQRTVISAMKQCRRLWVMEVVSLQALNDVVGAADEVLLWLEFRAAKPLGQVLGDLPRSTSLTALIGPEGGWDDAEWAYLDSIADMRRVIVASNVLRIETAAAAVAATVGAWRLE
jgi:16S rRNA (uracil1498-N3)-methyltransferase